MQRTKKQSKRKPANPQSGKGIPRRRQRKPSKSTDATLDFLEDVQYSIDFLTAILLLTGQLVTTGIFLVPDGLAFASSGDVFGFPRVEGRTPALSVDLDFIDVVSALLLILGQVRVLGPYLSGSGLFIVYSGQIFGYKSIPAAKVPASEKSKLFGQVIQEMALNSLEDG